MLALSPPFFSTTYGYDLITQNLQQDDFAPENSTSMSSKKVVNGNNDDSMQVAKKLNHNASERERRKRVNELYSFLRSLLPMSSDRMKKVSIPCIVSRALKYIPELQQEVQRLEIKKEKLVSTLTSSTNIRNSRAKETMIHRTSIVVSSVGVLGETEVVIQLIISSFGDMNNKNNGLLSKALEYLEEEEESLVLLSVTSFKCLGEERLLYTLHFQVHGDHILEAEKLKEKLYSLY